MELKRNTGVLLNGLLPEINRLSAEIPFRRTIMEKSCSVLYISGLLLFVVTGALVFNHDTAGAQVFALLGIGNILADIAFKVGKKP